MKPIEERVTDLGLSKRLKDSGFPQECLHSWIKEYDNDKWHLVGSRDVSHRVNYAAPLADEIMDELNVTGFYFRKLEKSYRIEFAIKDYEDKNFANVLAKFWLHLKENKLI